MVEGSLCKGAVEGSVTGGVLKKFTGYNSKSKPCCRVLRKNMTRQECRLWYDFLRDYPVKFYRQRSIDRFIADFYCSKAHLVIEVDGSQHSTAKGRVLDAERDAVLNSYGVTVIRVTNKDIEQNFFETCVFLDARIKENLSIWVD